MLLPNAISPLSYLKRGNTFDTDAQAFITAASITDPTLINAYNSIVINLKVGLVNGSNLWTDVWDKAIWLLTSGSATANAVNLRNPGTYDLTFFNSPTHIIYDGIAVNGTTQYWKTGLVPDVVLTLNNVSHSYAVKSNTVADSDRYGMGSYVGSNQRLDLQSRDASNKAVFRSYKSANQSIVSAAAGLVTGTRTASNASKSYMNDTIGTLNTNTVTGTQPSVEIFGACLNIGGVANNFHAADTFRIMAVGEGMTDAQYADWYAAYSQFETDLGL